MKCIFRVAVLCLVVWWLFGCTSVRDWSVQDWDLYYKGCKIKLDWDSGEVECTWRV